MRGGAHRSSRNVFVWRNQRGDIRANVQSQNLVRPVTEWKFKRSWHHSSSTAGAHPKDRIYIRREVSAIIDSVSPQRFDHSNSGWKNCSCMSSHIVRCLERSLTVPLILASHIPVHPVILPAFAALPISERRISEEYFCRKPQFRCN
jgi:hypothetical protein